MSFRRRTAHVLALLITLAALIAGPAHAAPSQPESPAVPRTNVVRFAQFNASVNRGAAGALLSDLATQNNQQLKNVAEIIQRTNPDVLLVNEFDFYSSRAAVRLFQRNYLGVSQNGADPVTYPYVLVAPSNTGIASGFDLNNNGVAVTTPGQPGYGDDAFGFGAFPGQFGLALFSKYPIDREQLRTFQTFLWRDMPGALLPDDPATPAPGDWYSPDELNVFRLSSKSHWDVPIRIRGQVVHVLVSHPTPPVFDGPEDRNGRRNHDEIRFWADYITPARGEYIYDDNRKRGGLRSNARFVIMGDQNADPNDGDSVDSAVNQLLDSALINTTVAPTSVGGPEQAALQGGLNASHESDPAYDTADFADTTPGNLRADYVLPSQRLRITAAHVFWPESSDPLFRLVGTFDPALPGGFPSSDHRLVWVDVDVVPEVRPLFETPAVYDADEFPSGGRAGDADDPAIWLHPSNPGQSLILGALKNGGLDVYDTRGKRLQEINPGDIRYNNVDVAYRFELAGHRADIAIATDRRNDLLAIWLIDARTRRLTNVTAPDAPLVFTPAGGTSNGATTAYGLTLYRSPISGTLYAFVTQREANKIAQLELFEAAGKVSYRTVRTIELPFEGDLEDAQSEGMVADSELGALYIGQENVGFWKFDAEPSGSATGSLIVAVDEDGGQVQADVEGLTIYKTPGGGGYLLVSSQGDSTFAVYRRSGDNAYLGSFSVGGSGRIDAVQQSDGAQVLSTAVGKYFPRGLLVVHDGLNDPPLYIEDDGEIENASTSFKYVRWGNVANALGLERGPQPVDPRAR